MMILYLCLFVLGVCYGHEHVHNRGIMRPCPNLNMNCIRAFVTQYSRCQPVYGPPTDTLSIDYMEMPLPHVNVTFIWEDAKVTGMDNWKFKEFYINKKTNKLVLEVELVDVTTDSPASSLIYYFKGREPVQLTAYFSITYLNMSLTMTAPFDSVKGIIWRRRVVFAYFGVDTAPYIVGKDLVNTEVRPNHDEMLGNLKNGLREASPVVGAPYFKMFMNNFLCKI